MYYHVFLVLSILVLSGASSAGSISTRSSTDATWDSFMASLFFTTQTGDGTYYGAGADSGGTCTLSNPAPSFITSSSSPIHATVALNIASWDNSIPCGMCANVTASGQGSGANPITGNFLVFVNNQCPGCSKGDLDFALAGDGRWDISWVGVECPVGTSNMQYMFVGGSSAYYVKMQIRNTNIPVLNAYVNQGGNWVAFAKTNDNFFSTAGSQVTTPISLPLSLKIESVAGTIVYDSLSAFGADNVILQANVQFPSISGTTPPSTGDTASDTGSSTASDTGSSTASSTASNTASNTGSNTASTGSSKTSTTATGGSRISTGDKIITDDANTIYVNAAVVAAMLILSLLM